MNIIFQQGQLYLVSGQNDKHDTKKEGIMVRKLEKQKKKLAVQFSYHNKKKEGVKACRENPKDIYLQIKNRKYIYFGTDCLL